jgi:hypothetical protein
MSALKITYKRPAQLRARARNPRTHTKKQIQQIAASITHPERKAIELSSDPCAIALYTFTATVAGGYATFATK